MTAFAGAQGLAMLSGRAVLCCGLWCMRCVAMCGASAHAQQLFEQLVKLHALVVDAGQHGSLVQLCARYQRFGWADARQHRLRRRGLLRGLPCGLPCWNFGCAFAVGRRLQRRHGYSLCVRFNRNVGGLSGTTGRWLANIGVGRWLGFMGGARTGYRLHAEFRICVGSAGTGYWLLIGVGGTETGCRICICISGT